MMVCKDCSHELVLLNGTCLHRYIADYNHDNCVCYRLKIPCDPEEVE